MAVIGRHGQAVSVDAVETASASLQHRGSDDRGAYIDRHVAFGFRRLSIIDTSPAGHQPMASPDGLCTIVFNGEIYNYVELKAKLMALGHQFRSITDTEVLLAGYLQWGADCVHRFNGMWALLIHDRRTDIVFGARDRLGVKPLYLWQDDKWFVLASEPRAVGATGLTTLQPDWTRVADALAWNLMDHDDGTTFAGVRQVPAGSRFVITANGRYQCEAFWTLPRGDASDPSAIDDDHWINTLRCLLIDSVRMRQRSDVPIGFTLSGGIDSTILITEAARLNDQHAGLLAFAYQDEAYDEKMQIADTVTQTGARLVSINERDLDLSVVLPALVHANGEMVHSMSAVANYSLFRLAAEHGVKVVIGGQGADEAFAGYSTYEEGLWLAMLNDLHLKSLICDIAASSRMRQRSAVRVALGVLRRAMRLALTDTRLYAWARDRAPRRLPLRAYGAIFSAKVCSKQRARRSTSVRTSSSRMRNDKPCAGGRCRCICASRTDVR